MEEKKNLFDFAEEEENIITESKEEMEKLDYEKIKNLTPSDWKKIWLKMLSETELSEETQNNIKKYCEERDFFNAPASTIFHNNFEGGLCLHSINVALTLKKIVDINSEQGLCKKFKRNGSAYIIGLLHDLCKTNIYSFSTRNVKNELNVWVKVPFYKMEDKNPLLGVHGDRSVATLLILQNKINDFTIQELSCIRFHMGANQEGDVKAFSAAKAIEPLIAWTHMADDIASLNEEVKIY